MDTSKELGLDALRIYLGLALIGKGYYFMTNLNELFELTSSAVSYGDFLLAHYVIFAHIVGGMCIATGLLTRIAVFANLPILVGAITLVHLPQGLFTNSQGLEVSLMVFFLLCIVLYHGSGKLSVDYFIDDPKGAHEFTDNIIDFAHYADKKKTDTKNMDESVAKTTDDQNIDESVAETTDDQNIDDHDKAA
jgi:uncharacterized membrane protein YphA (DoxX/SURF4 family)